MPFDIKSVRSQFQALNQDQIFMDNAGGSQTLTSVADSVATYLKTNNVQLGASYPVSQLSTQRVDQGYEAAAKCINASSKDIVLGGSTTQLFLNLSNALHEHFQPGDEIILSEIDHEANIASWERMAKRLKLNIKWWTDTSLDAANPSPILTPENLAPLLTPKTKFVACTHASNILGTIHDIASLAKKIKEVSPDALFTVDAVAYAPHGPVDVKAFGVDFYAFSWYKVYGPHISMLYASEQGQKALTNLDHYFNQKDPSHQDLDSMLGVAAGNYELSQSIEEVEKYLAQDGMWQGIEKQEEAMQTKILDWLAKDERITVYGVKTGERSKRVPVISFTVKGWKSQDFVEEVEKRSNYGIRWGHFYSHRLITKLLGLTEDGIVRISLVHYNTEEEVDGLLKVFGEILK